MKAKFKLLGILVAFSLFALQSHSASAKFFPCDFPGSCVEGSPNTPCSCPQSSNFPGRSVTCGNQAPCYLIPD